MRKLKPCELMFQGVRHTFTVAISSPAEDSDEDYLGLSYTASVYVHNQETGETELVCLYSGNDHNELHSSTFQRAAGKCYEHLASKGATQGVAGAATGATNTPANPKLCHQPHGLRPRRRTNRPFIKNLQWRRRHDQSWPVWTFSQDVLDEIVAGLDDFRWAELKLRDHRGQCVGQIRFDHRIVLHGGNDGQDYYKIDVGDIQRRFPELVVWYAGYTEDSKHDGGAS